MILLFILGIPFLMMFGAWAAWSHAKRTKGSSQDRVRHGIALALAILLGSGGLMILAFFAFVVYSFWSSTASEGGD